MSNPKFFQRLMLGTSAVLVFTVGLPARAQEMKKVSKADAVRAIASRVNPEYPSNARQLHIEGAVELEVAIAENGSVDKVDILAGNPMLTRPAANAVRTWKFTPFTEGGKPVKAVAPITIVFKQ